jgi:hypothetical protein
MGIQKETYIHMDLHIPSTPKQDFANSRSRQRRIEKSASVSRIKEFSDRDAMLRQAVKVGDDA